MGSQRDERDKQAVHYEALPVAVISPASEQDTRRQQSCLVHADQQPDLRAIRAKVSGQQRDKDNDRHQAGVAQ